MRILDATAGYRAMWKGKPTENVVFVDRRLQVRPDVLADDRWLPFRDGVFGAIYFDPPFLHGRGGWSHDKFGGFGTYDDLRELFRKGCKEFARVLSASGMLIVKLMRSSSSPKHHTSLFMMHLDFRFAEYAQVAGFRIKSRYIRKSRGGHRACQVVWMTFRLE